MRFNEIDYKTLGCHKGDLKASSQTIKLEASIDYLNLNLTKFEPLLEPFVFDISMENYVIFNS
jgi:hypothetical protein